MSVSYFLLNKLTLQIYLIDFPTSDADQHMYHVISFWSI